MVAKLHKLLDSKYLQDDSGFYTSYSQRCIESGHAYLSKYLDKKIKEIPKITKTFFYQGRQTQFKSIKVPISHEDGAWIDLMYDILYKIGLV